MLLASIRHTFGVRLMHQVSVYFSRDGQEIDTRYQCCRRVGFGVPTGRVGISLCFDNITVRNRNGDCWDLDESDFGKQPVTVKVWQPGRPSMMFGIAHADTVERIEMQTA